jgi:hypothetical protein
VYSWEEFTEQSPEAAALGARILAKYGIAYLATIRRSGAPRVHPVCPVVLDGKLLVGIIASSPKRYDLDRDGRYVLHALPGPNDAEFALSGVARRLSAEEVERLAAGAGPKVRLSAASAMYELRFDRADTTTFERGPDDVPVPIHGRWPDGDRPT